MIKAILVDDEPINNTNLAALLNRHCKGIEIVTAAQSAEEARSKIIEWEPDVVFLDIEMPGMNGFELLKTFDNPCFDVVFVTAYDSYGIKAVKFSALDYILKPINSTELKAAVEKIENSVRVKKQNLRLKNLLSLLDNTSSNTEDKIALSTLKETYFIAIKDILRCVSSNNYTTFFLANGDEYLISKPLYEYDELLTPYGFIRCHQSHLVNKLHVRSIVNEDSGYLVLGPAGHKIPISRQKKGLVKSILKI